jgi:hypothetical protein
MIEPHKDRSTGLVIFGALHILLGAAAVVLLLATAASAEMLARRGPNAPQIGIAESLLFYGVAAFYCFAAGIGSIRARRWARALAAAVSALWTIAGVFALAVLFIVLPHIMVLIPPSQETTVRVTSVVFVVVAMILLPLVIALFYASRDTALTCDERDPATRWTDRVPVPVLALCIVLGFGAATMLINLGKPVYVFFGYVMSGAPAALTVIAFAILFAVLTVQIYRLKESAWWVLLLLHVIAGTLAVVALARTNLAEVYRRMGMLTPQVEAMHLEQITRSAALWAMVVAGWIGYLWFLLWLRRYFAARVRTSEVVAASS